MKMPTSETHEFDEEDSQMHQSHNSEDIDISFQQQQSYAWTKSEKCNVIILILLAVIASFLVLQLQLHNSQPTLKSTPEIESKIDTNSQQHDTNMHEKSSQEKSPGLLGEYIGQQPRPKNKEISLKNYQALQRIGVPFYSLQKYKDPLNPPIPPQYFNISLVPQYQQLPICIIAIDQSSENSYKFKAIKSSVQAQQYQNYKLAIDYQFLSSDNLTIKHLKNKVDFTCPQKSIVLLAENPLKEGALFALNSKYQKHYTWLTFHQQKPNNQGEIGYHGITSFYNKFLQNLPIKNIPLSSGKNYDDLYVAMIQTGYSHAYRISYSDIFASLESRTNNLAQIHNTFNPQHYAYILYNSTTYLSSNYYLDKMDVLLTNYIKLKEGSGPGYLPEQGTYMNPFQIERNLENIGLKDLPKEHLLFQRENNYLELKYNLSQIKQEKTMCVVMLSNNNIEGDRYKYAIDTVFAQNYTNFHIVFIDDASSDSTLNKTKDRVAEMRYNESKIDYIRNNEKKYATYNIKNAGDNYCKAGEVLVLIDGDDQVIGVNALKILNMGYVRQNKWLVYSSYFSTSLTYGGSKDPNPQFFLDEVRVRYYLIGPIRSFYVDLFRMIKQSDHKDDDGNFLPNYYDGALQYPLFQMCGPDKILYIPEISYLYTINYHSSDARSKDHPRQKYQAQIYARPRYERLNEQEYERRREK